jgi:hypothetical protein
LDGELGSELRNVEMGRVGAFVLLPEGDMCVALCGVRGSTSHYSILASCNLDSGSDEWRIKLPEGREYERMSLSADGKTLALSGHVVANVQEGSRGKEFIEFRSTANGDLIGQLEATQHVGPFGFIDDKSFILIEGGGATEWDVSSCSLLRRRNELPVRWFGQVSSAVNRLMTVDGRLDGGGPRFFELTTGKEIGGGD